MALNGDWTISWGRLSMAASHDGWMRSEHTPLCPACWGIPECGCSCTRVLLGGFSEAFSSSLCKQNAGLEASSTWPIGRHSSEVLWHTEGSEATVLWACSLEKYSRTHWALAWMVTVLGTCCILLALVLRKEALKGWLRILKEDYHSRGIVQGRRVLILYSPDHVDFEHLVGILAGALAKLQFSVSLELWSRGELGSLGPMQWLHAQRREVLQDGGAIVLLFSRGAVAGCAEWLGWEQTDVLCPIKPDSTFLASLNCALPDFLAGKASGKYTVICFEELLSADEIPALFRTVPVYPLPSQLFNFLLALAGPHVGQEQRSSLRRHAVWIIKTLERAVQGCQPERPPTQNLPLLPPQLGDEQLQETSSLPCANT
ncbi:Interleukin-17 receptor C [Varanus komodoensis]|nr:Interleukin-17 receptor C [Varanus komodoensis]